MFSYLLYARGTESILTIRLYKDDNFNMPNSSYKAFWISMATYDNLDTLVASVVGATEDVEAERVDLTCEEVLTDEFILDDTASVISNQKKCSQTQNGCGKFKNKDLTFVTESRRSLKREHLLPNDGDLKQKSTRRSKKQKSLLDGPIVPLRPTVEKTEVPDFLQKVRSRMITVSLLAILLDLTYLLDLEAVYLLLDIYQEDQRTIDQWTVEAREVLQTFIMAVQESLVNEPGIKYLQDSKRIHSDRTWSTTSCGIVTKRTVVTWLDSSMKKIDPAVYTPIPNIANRSSSSAVTTLQASDTFTYSTTASGPVGSAAAAASTGTGEITLTDGLLQHARLKQTTGCASSVIYVADSDASYKYASETRNGDIQLDFRLYKMKDVMNQLPQDLWRRSIIRGKIAARSETPRGMLPDPVYTAIQNLVKAIQTCMTNDPATEVTRLGSQWKRSNESS